MSRVGKNPISIPSGTQVTLEGALLKAKGKLGELSRYTLLLTRRALATAGVTNVPQRVKRLQREGLRRSRFRFAIFDRQGEPCYTCGTEGQRIEVNSRRLYLCSRCQPRRRV